MHEKVQSIGMVRKVSEINKTGQDKTHTQTRTRQLQAKQSYIPINTATSQKNPPGLPSRKARIEKIL